MGWRNVFHGAWSRDVITTYFSIHFSPTPYLYIMHDILLGEVPFPSPIIPYVPSFRPNWRTVRRNVIADSLGKGPIIIIAWRFFQIFPEYFLEYHGQTNAQTWVYL